MLARPPSPMARCGGLAVALVLMGCAGLVGQQARLPVPEQAKLEEARKLARDLYGPEYESAKTRDALGALVTKLLGQAEQTADDPAARWVLFEMAAEAAARMGDGRAALRATERIAETFEVDGLAKKTELLEKLAGAARFPPQHRSLALLTIPLVAEAADEDQYESALGLGRIALAAAQRSKDKALVKQIVTINKEIHDAQKAYAKVEAARQTLEASPADPEANLAVGRHLCLAKGKWDEGVSMLALGSDPELKAVAVADLKGPASPEEQLSLGDRWWDLAEKAEAAAKWHLQSRAAHWYRKALPQLSGLVKTKIEQRLDSIAHEAPSSLGVAPRWVRIVNANSGLCLAVGDASSQPGAKLCQATVHEGAREQHWQITVLDGDWCAILNRQSGQALVNTNSSKQPGEHLTQWPFNEAAAEHQWALVPVGPGLYGVLNRNSGLCTAVAFGSKRPGMVICQWPFNKSLKEHQWRILPAER